MPRWKTFLAFGCVHRPIHDEAACQWVIREIRERQPNYVVNLGDLIDTACLSSFEQTGDEAALISEYESAGEFLQQVKDARPRARKVWTQGNHDERPFRKKWNKLAGLLDYRKRIAEAKDWQHFDYEYRPESVFRIGQCSFYHGFTAGRNTCKNESVKLGIPYGLTVSAHTHRPHPVHRISMGVTPLPYWMVNPGTLIGKADYMKTLDSSLWGQGIVYGKCRPDVTGLAIRQYWEAEMLLRKMLWDVGSAA